MAEYITKEEAVQELYKVSHRLSDPPIDTTENEIIKVLHSLMHKIEQIPSADVAEVKHAYYEVVPNQHKNQAVPDVRCSNCQRVLKRKKENYCPHCGAKMDGGKNGKKIEDINCV